MGWKGGGEQWEVGGGKGGLLRLDVLSSGSAVAHGRRSKPPDAVGDDALSFAICCGSRPRARLGPRHVRRLPVAGLTRTHPVADSRMIPF